MIQTKTKTRVGSPCVSICTLDDADICVGCQRSVDEIMRWSQMTDDERLEVLRLVAEREEPLLF